MYRETIIRRYLNELSDGNTNGIISLFSDNAKVKSPVYGIMLATEFYTKLAEDTSSSEIKLLQIYQSITDYEKSDEWAACFNYKWTLLDGILVDFDVVDLFKFNADNLITELRIIYDLSLIHI